jgi:hypothetical protein
LRRIVLIAGAASAVQLAAPAPAPAIEHGTPDPADPQVVALVTVNPCTDDPPGVFCTGTVVGARAVLTAAHCVNQRAPFLIQVFEGSDLAAPGRFLQVSSIELHPAFSEAGGELVNDLAIVALAEDSSAAPLAVVVEPLDESAVGRSARIVGFGLGDGETGLKREGTVRVDGVGETELRVVPDPSMSCVADSGGPLLFGDALAGVVSSGDPACAEFGDYTRADVFAVEFIEPAVARAAAAPAPPDPATFCTACERDDDCQEGLVCAPANAGIDTCQPGLPPGEDDGGGCAVGGPRSRPAGALVVLLLLCLARASRACRRCGSRS